MKIMSDYYTKFDALLSTSDYDSQDWSDGLGLETAKDYIGQFSAHEWNRLATEWSDKPQLWRGCLISVLHPGYGKHAEDIIFAMLDDPNEDVSYLALSVISFYCGVNDGKNGPFEDKRILNERFKAHVAATDGITEKILAIRAGCHPLFQARFDLLLKLLNKP